MSRKINPAEVYDVSALEVPRVARSREEINLALDIGFFDTRKLLFPHAFVL